MNTPPKKRNGKQNDNWEQPGYDPNQQKNTREGGDDALAGNTETDARADEKVIVNEQRENKAVNGSSQTSPMPSESESSEFE
jgi:hypothetical protein